MSPRKGQCRPIADRFWGKVRKSENCWVWTRGRCIDGYGKFWVVDRTIRAHRASWKIHYGRVPDGLQVLHRCDNPPCVRPDNMHDKENKGRYAPRLGEDNSGAKLTAEDVMEIRRLRRETKLPQQEIADLFGIDRKNVSHIERRKTWAHLE